MTNVKHGGVLTKLRALDCGYSWETITTSHIKILYDCEIRPNQPSIHLGLV